ncbi:Hypothetical protein PBC10988_22220 [Planctomycetales bacterium 10988]|nr:Hypothetical protein PBC10988_22220 [Planctomycetales bacterium 10988]
MDSNYPPETEQAPSVSRPFQFRLRTLLGLILVVALILALYRWLGVIPVLLMGWFVLLIAGHVLGNVLGTEGPQLPPGDSPRRKPLSPDGSLPKNVDAQEKNGVERQHVQAIPAFQQRSDSPEDSICKRGLLLFIGAGAAGGMGLGIWFAYLTGQTNGPSLFPILYGLLVASGSGAVLGGWLFALTGCCVSSGKNAWAQQKSSAAPSPPTS